MSDARSRIAGRPAGPYQKIRVLKAWVGQEANPPPRFRVRALPFSRGSFNLLARLILGELPVGRARALYQHRSSLSDFGKSRFGKRACLHCFLEKILLFYTQSGIGFLIVRNLLKFCGAASVLLLVIGAVT